jgi:hypothetical protein
VGTILKRDNGFYSAYREEEEWDRHIRELKVKRKKK